jgi:hypothetical protein
MTGQMTMRGAHAPVTGCGTSIGGKSFALWNTATSMYPNLRVD